MKAMDTRTALPKQVRNGLPSKTYIKIHDNWTAWTYGEELPHNDAFCIVRLFPQCREQFIIIKSGENTMIESLDPIVERADLAGYTVEEYTVTPTTDKLFNDIAIAVDHATRYDIDLDDEEYDIVVIS